MLAIDVDKGRATHVGLTGTAEDLVDVAGTDGDGSALASVTGITTAINVTANGYLRLSSHSRQEHQQTDYGLSNSQCISCSSKQFNLIDHHRRIVQIGVRQLIQIGGFDGQVIGHALPTGSSY